MKLKNRFFVPAIAGIMLLSSCELITGIFKAGMWTGVILVIVVVALVIWLVSKIFGGSRD